MQFHSVFRAVLASHDPMVRLFLYAIVPYHIGSQASSHDSLINLWFFKQVEHSLFCFGTQTKGDALT